MGEIEIFKCYSRNLKDFLRLRKIKYIVEGINPKIDKHFWAYIKNDKLDEALSIWKNNKPTYDGE